jgi:hypothetical protein
MSNYIPLRLDLRGSLNLPAEIKRSLNLPPGASVMVRQIGGVVLLVPTDGPGGEAIREGRLETWLADQLDQPVPAAPVQVGKTALAATIRLQAAREKFEQQKAVLQYRLQIAQQQTEAVRARREARQEARQGDDAPTRQRTTPPDPMFDPIAELRAAREAAATRQLDAALQQASDEMAGEQAPPPGLPQA